MKGMALKTVATMIAISIGACGGRAVVRHRGVTSDPASVRMIGNHIEIDQHIMFALNSEQILESSSTILDQLAAFLSRHPSDVRTLHVIGHTDQQGSRAHNQDLSERRALAVVQALQSRGVTQSLEAIGRGMDERLCEENTEACHERNRRVEFLIVN